MGIISTVPGYMRLGSVMLFIFISVAVTRRTFALFEQRSPALPHASERNEQHVSWVYDIGIGNCYTEE